MLNYEQIRQHQLTQRNRSSPARSSKILVLGFAVIILIGTVLLKLPISTENPSELGWLDALFTATSATTVTGLAVLPTAITFTRFGEFVILGLIQVGGVGFIVLSVVLLHLIGRRVTLFERHMVQQNLGVDEGQNIITLTLYVTLLMLIFELIGTVFLFSQWVGVMRWDIALYYAVFHSISAYCNAGFDLFNGTDDPMLLHSRQNPIIIFTLSALITLGTLGITVLYDMLTWVKFSKLSLHTRLILPFTISLTLIGMVIMLIDEWFVEGHALYHLPLSEQLLLSFFTIVSSRTAGITFIPMAELGEASQLIIFVWMFIGGAPASMGGGVGLSTIMVLLVTLSNTVRGHENVRIFQRTIPLETISKATAVVTVSTLLVLGITLSLALLDEGKLFPIMFEVVSAFSNTGYSLDITANFSPMGRLLLIFTMFWGRLGPLTLVVALAQRQQKSLIRYPEERIIIG